MDTLTHHATREAQLAALSRDDRYQYSAALMDVLSSIATALAHIRQPLAEMDEQYAMPDTALQLLAALGQSARNVRPAAVVDNLLTEARDTAVKLAKANEATWEQIGDALGMSRQNAYDKYSRK